MSMVERSTNNWRKFTDDNMIGMIRCLYNYLKKHYCNFLLWSTYFLFRKGKEKSIRKKKTITVLFVLAELGSWKTKLLYEAMLKHPRFKPILGVTEAADNPSGKNLLTNFLEEHNYSFIDLDTKQKGSKISPDIIFYQKPYDFAYRNPAVRIYKHLNSLFCFVNYGLHVVQTFWSTNQILYKCLWHQYFENQLAANPNRMAMLPDGGKQVVITGLPVQDQLLFPKEQYIDPWKSQEKPKKRIIYAPHHTIGNIHLEGLATSSFLENSEIMVELMHKYADTVQWAFKPHPLLYPHLLKVWGKDKTDTYYNEWKNAENAQLENGEYDALFKYSDAMIHDCSSFTIEYHYTQNPVMYLIRKKNAENEMSPFGQKAFDLHYKGCTKEDIEKFIQNVIDGVDPMKEEREKFYDNYLIPPHGKTACENIINAILGEAEYKNQ